MQKPEFLERQSCFEFFSAQGYAMLKKFVADCRKGWRKLFKLVKPRFENVTGWLDFVCLQNLS
jgi:hypothetical protein